MPKKPTSQRASVAPQLPRWQVTYLDTIGERGQSTVRATDRADAIGEFWRLHPSYAICYVGLVCDLAAEAVGAEKLIPKPGEAAQPELAGIVPPRKESCRSPFGKPKPFPNRVAPARTLGKTLGGRQ